MAGYSKKGLVEKLGIKPGHKVLLVAAPEGYDKVLGDLPAGVKPARGAAGKALPKGAPFDFIQAFFHGEKEFAKAFKGLKAALAKAGMLWISWPKKTALSKEEAKDPDVLDENKVRALALAGGLVDVKVCAVEETWSGLKLVYRLADR